MNTITIFHYGPAIIAVCSLGALMIAGVMLVCAWICLVKAPDTRGE